MLNLISGGGEPRQQWTCGTEDMGDKEQMQLPPTAGKSMFLLTTMTGIVTGGVTR
jgi:hypothetical protein